MNFLNSNSDWKTASSLVIIDSNIENYHDLISGIEDADILFLDADRDGIEQITERLSNYNKLDNIQILSHGSNSSLQLGNTFLNQSSLDRYRDDLSQWGEALSSDGDILFFGCNLAADEQGLTFIEQVSQITQADVAASDNLTGHSSLGGDWELEVSVGNIDTPISISTNARSEFEDILATIGESGRITNLNHQWRTVSLQHSYENPVVIAGPPSLNGGDPTTVRVRNVTADSFQMRLNEWEYLDEFHGRETVGYVVMEAGVHTLDDGTVITAGTQTGIDHEWETISFGSIFDSAPVVLAQTTSENGTFAVSERIRSVGTNSFEIRLQEEEAADNIHAEESIGWLAIKTGSGSTGSGAYLTGKTITNHIGSTILLNGQFDAAPVVLANINTYAGPDTAAVRLIQASANQISLNLEEETSRDAETTRVNDTVGFLTLEAGLITTDFGTNPETLLDNRAVAQWTFNDPAAGGQVADVSTLGGNNPGFLRNGASLESIGGSLDGVATFDGENDFIAVADTPDINLSTNAKRTVTAWFKVDNKTIFLPNSADDRKQVIYEEGGVDRGLNIYIENGLLYVGGWNENESNWSGTYLSTDEIESNTWHHVALVLDAQPGVNNTQAGAFSAYLDGVQFGEGVGSQLSRHFGNIGLGAVDVDTQFHDREVRGTAVEAFAGQLADVKIYNQVLSAADISSQVTAIADEIAALNNQGILARETIVSGLAQPEAIDWIPNTQTMLIVEKAGTVKVLQNGTLLDTPFIDISDQVNNDTFATRGITDIAIHPDFEENPYVYLLYAYDPPEVYNSENINDPFAGPDKSGVRGSRMIRVTADASTNYTTAVPNSEVVLLGTNSTWDNYDGSVNPFAEDSAIRNNPSGILPDGTNIQDYIAIESNFHNSGSIEFGPDGALYVSSGDSTTARVDTGVYRSQDIDNLSGKILRIDPITGDGLSDNPFFNGDPDANRSKVYQYGLRNPFRITVNPNTGAIFTSDTGWNTWEEINTGGAGANFGWPYYEGANGVSAQTPEFINEPQNQAFYANPTPVVAPIIALSQAGDGVIAIIMGDFYLGDRYPEQYQGDLFFVDSTKGIVRNASFDSSGNVVAVNRFTTGANGVAQIMEGPDGYLYYVDLNDGLIGRWLFD